MDREDIFQVNTFRDDAKTFGKRRWCLIGDHAVWRYQIRLQEICRPLGISVDWFVMSLGIEDEAYKKELEHFFMYKEYKYEVLFVAWGYHHDRNWKVFGNEQKRKSFLSSYEKLMQICINECDTLLILSGRVENVLEGENDEIKDRNRLNKQMADKFGYLYIDIYQFMVDNIDEFKFKDSLNFENQHGYDIISDYIWQFMLMNKLLSEDGMLIKSGKY